MAKVYSRDDHRQAWEAWADTRNMSESARVIGATYFTPKRWSQADFICSFGCPYHDWEKLLDERDMALTVRKSLIDQGVHDPVIHDRAMRNAIQEVVPRSQSGPVMALIRSDLERLHHWEYMYGKVYFDLTGVAISYGEMKEGEQETRDQYRAGLHATSLEGGLRSLKLIQDQIDALQGSQRERPTERVPGSLVAEQLGIEDLRRMKRLAQETPPHKLATMLAVVKADNATTARTA